MERVEANGSLARGQTERVPSRASMKAVGEMVDDQACDCSLRGLEAAANDLGSATAASWVLPVL